VSELVIERMDLEAQQPGFGPPIDTGITRFDRELSNKATGDRCANLQLQLHEASMEIYIYT